MGKKAYAEREEAESGTGSIFPDKGFWWEQEGDAAGPAMTALAQELWTLDAPRRDEFERNLRRFGGKTLRGVFQGAELFFDRNNLRLNVTKAVTETLTAKIGSNRPRPKVLTDGGNWSLRRRGKQLQNFLDGTYQTAEVYSKIPLQFRDAMLGGTGIVHFFPDYGARRTSVERVFPLEIVVDPVEAVNGDPRTLYRFKFLDKGKLKRQFPEYKGEIERQKPVDQSELPDFWTDGRATRMVCVVEAWYLADYDAKGKIVPGRHVIACGDCTLCEEPYEETEFPFEFFHWSAPTRGFWGDSAVAEIRGVEREVNRLLQHIQKSMKLAGMPWILSPTDAKVKSDKLTNEIGSIIKFDGPTPPTIASFQAVHPQVMEHLWALYAKAFEILGTNQLQASATKPPGIDSGRALEQLGEEHLVRFKHVSKAFEDMVGRRFAAQFVRCAKQLDAWLKDNNVSEGYVLKAYNNKTTLKIAWSDCSLGSDEFFLQTWPTSVLPITPSGRTEEVERWQQNGWITPERAQDLLEFPDLESEANLVKADSELLEYQLERMVDYGEEIFPEPRQNLETALQRGTYAFERAKITDVPPEHLDRLEQFLNACEEMIQKAAPPVQPVQVPIGPDGVPLPPGSMGPQSPQGMPGMPPGAPGPAAPM